MKYLILCFIIIGCTQKPSQQEILRAADLIRGQEDECKQIANDLGYFSYDYGNDKSPSGNNWLCEIYANDKRTYESRRVMLYREELEPIIRYLSIKKHLKEKYNETCKLPRTSKPKASPSPSKNGAK